LVADGPIGEGFPKAFVRATIVNERFSDGEADGGTKPGPFLSRREMSVMSPDTCWLCERALGSRIERHHPVPKSRGGRETVSVHPICHRTLHATFANADLARRGADVETLRQEPAVVRFLGWVAKKPPDFHARTAKRKR
jgi:hypothetical protein